MDDGNPATSAVKSPQRPLTTTSYAILGLLSVRSWSAYELTDQMKRGLRYTWPRTETRIYQEPKHLVESIDWQVYWFERYIDGNARAVPPDASSRGASSTSQDR